jgi:hypothetical protein
MNSLIRKHWQTGLAVVGLLGLFAFLCPRLVDFFQYILAVLRYPYTWVMTENENMLYIHALAHGQNAYSMKDANAFLYFVYPPLFHIISALLTKLFGFTILIPRLLSVASLLSYFSLVFLFFRDKLTRIENGLLTLVLIGFSVSVAFYAHYYVLARADLLAIALAFGSLYFAWQIIYQKQTSRLVYWLSGGLAVAALFTKQSLFFPYLVLLGLTLLAKDRKEWLRFGMYVGIATMATFLILQIVTAGGFWQSMTMASDIYGKYLNVPDHLLRLRTIFESHYWPLLLTIPAILALRAFRSFTLWVFVAIFINFLITGGNQGAAHNTLIPLLFGIILVAKELYSAGPIGKLIFIVLCGLQIFVLGSIKAPYFLPSATDRSNQEQLVEYLKSTPQQTILGDRIDYATLLAGKKSPIEASTHNVARGWVKTEGYAKMAEENLLAKLKNGEITTAVVSITGFGKTELLDYIKEHGVLVKSITINHVDVPEYPHQIYSFTTQ